MKKVNNISNVSISTCALMLTILFLLLPFGCMTQNTMDPLTKEERAWLSEHDGKIRLAHDPDARPVDYLDKEGNFKGLAADYVRRIEKRLDFKFDILEIKTWKEVLSKAKRKEVDVLCAFTKNRERQQWLLFTEPYLIIKTVILTRDDFKGNLSLDTIHDKKVTFTRGWVVDDYLKKNYSHLNVLPAVDADAAMNNLITEKADAWVTALTVASIKIEDQRVTNIRVAGETDLSFKLAIASRKDQPILNSILKKGLALISEDERSDIFNNWIHIRQESIVQSREFWIIVFVITGVAVFPVIIVFIWNKALKRKVDEKTAALEIELSERKQVQEALRNSEERYRSLIETQTDLVCRFSSDGTFLFVNEVYAEFFNKSQKELLGSR